MDEPRRVGWIASHYLSYVHDNSLWMPSGPIDGGRFRVTAGISTDFTNSRFDSYLLAAATGGTTSGSGSRAPGRCAPTASTAAATGRAG